MRRRHARIEQLQGLAVDRGPGKEERDFHVEDDEQQRDDVEPQVELHEARADRRLAALVDFELFGVGRARADEMPDQQIDEHEQKAQPAKQGQVTDDQGWASSWISRSNAGGRASALCFGTRAF